MLGMRPSLVVQTQLHASCSMHLECQLPRARLAIYFHEQHLLQCESLCYRRPFCMITFQMAPLMPLQKPLHSFQT